MRLLLALLLVLVPAALPAQEGLPPAPYAYRQLDDPRLEAQARELMATLRCLTCQSQSIADSDASMAGDMRHQVRSRLAAGERPEEIRAWLIGRYGDYISYQPAIGATTWPLFAVPALLLVGAALVIGRRLRRDRGKGLA
ncbi:cytochrome c-type biogenesis protein [Croceibacterium sp. TMG7-5b_MA50]|uniref:cytochrome c-type biogenesis protein n=1 Tax=Croceibacterium sp. TMG7-5b_MA50 TaxID=3121290 RepID=UPI003221AFCB